MTQHLEYSIIRILNHHGATVGTGFIVSARLGVTCAHVVRAAGGDVNHRIRIRFFTLQSTSASETAAEPQHVRVLQDGWSPPEADDVAFLEFSSIPESVTPVRLASATQCVGRRYASLGFARIASYEVRRPTDYIGGIVPARQKRPMLQLQGEEIKHGMSGAPVLDLTINRVVGMVSEYKDDERTRVAWATTADTLGTLHPSLSIPIVAADTPDDPQVQTGRQLSRQEIPHMVDLLLACPSMHDLETRKTVLDMLPPQILHAIRHHAQTRAHVMNIVRACQNYTGGLDTLVTAVRFFEGDSIPMQALDRFLARAG